MPRYSSSSPLIVFSKTPAIILRRARLTFAKSQSIAT
jgi:hypothetical protein